MPISSYLRPRFSLRALLVAMAVLCLLFWIHLDWIARRRAALAGEQVTATPILDPAGAEPRPPWLLGWFGEAGQSILIVHGCDADSEWEQERARLARLFPEAEIRRDVADPVFDQPQSVTPQSVTPAQ
jgi:hypothetical protein